MTWRSCADGIVRKHVPREDCPHCEGTTTPEQSAMADAASLDLFAAPTTPPSNEAKIILGDGSEVLVDAADLPHLSSFVWGSQTNGWGNRYVARKERGRTVLMHRQIMDAPSGMQVDHINGNGLDNRRANLRLCTNGQNQMNAKPRKGGTSRYKGVHWSTQKGKWMVTVQRDGKKCHVGFFDSEEDAAAAYNQAAGEVFGDFARLNTLPEGYKPPSNRTPTSDAAAASLTPETLSKQQRAVLEAIWKARRTGITDEGVQKATGLSGNAQRPRRQELERAGWVEQRVFEGKLQTAETASKRQAALWWPTRKMVDAVEALRQREAA